MEKGLAMTQRNEIICDRCGERGRVTRLTAYEFAVDCRCEGLISWAHAAEPPEFEEKGQLSLWNNLV